MIVAIFVGLLVVAVLAAATLSRVFGRSETGGRARLYDKATADFARAQSSESRSTWASANAAVARVVEEQRAAPVVVRNMPTPGGFATRERHSVRMVTGFGRR